MDTLRKAKRPAEWPKSGWYWFLDDDEVLEYTHDIDVRWDYQCMCKSLDELPVRLKAMRPVQGEVPEGITKARAARDEAWDACDKAWDAYYKARAARNKAWIAYDKAGAARDEARIACDEARIAYYKALKDSHNEIEELRLKECPDVPWDGKSLVYEEVEHE